MSRLCEGYQIRPTFSKPLSELKADCGGLNDKFFDRVHPIAILDGEFFRQKTNAEFIVKACNNYDKLVETLKGILMVAVPNSSHSYMEFGKEYIGIFNVTGNRLEEACKLLSQIGEVK